MNELLKEVFEKTAQLPLQEQEELAQKLLSELKNRAWDKKMADNVHVFDELAAQARAEGERGETVEGDW